MNKCPCYNCILIPMCIGKSYCNLLSCDLLGQYIGNWEDTYGEENRGFRSHIFSCVNPSMWSIDELNRIVDAPVFKSGTPVIID